ncbi:hypothetical protein TVAG_365490 [Trichomonas vaginalis G3]|uniref:Uncharacterized protein n=1 Tax=Trichomonas vaginalis (strain ATCC PRA-98 / G3) TaxID=412133 RepID=A2DHJ3_TRIV3|nr:spectrin binding [Trichomonas vaginalis G3]EAY20041.1 hypothetical protein TVAG_365490 [Trichomonas vaginalis G3]KAI5527992.1 spectrin binding [Trichomonas vaginalis G3]|eukprot:XP_001581027.1 hypothetical protein [Trichomonas vaginalis G3]
MPCDEPTSEGYTPLLLAAMNGNTNCVTFLSKITRNINYFYDQNSAMNYAAKWRDVKMMESLLAAGANINNPDKNGLTPLNEVSSDSIICAQFLLSKNANPNIPDIDGRTPLMNSIIHQKIPICSLLISFNADINLLDFEGKSALYYAINLENIDIVMILLSKGAKLYINTDDLHDCLDFAKQKNNQDILNIIEDYSTKRM